MTQMLAALLAVPRPCRRAARRRSRKAQFIETADAAAEEIKAGKLPPVGQAPAGERRSW